MKKFLNKSSVLLLLLTSCNFWEGNKIYTTSDCDNLSMSCFKGKPNDCYELKKACSTINYKFTKELCQSAFNQVLTGTSKHSIMQSYGEEVTGCFTEDQVEKYLKD